MSRSVFIASPEGSTGKSIVAFGLLDLLTRHVGKVGVYRPVTKGEDDDPVVRLLLAHPAIDQPLHDVFGVTYEEMHLDPVAALGEIVRRFHDLRRRYDAIVVLGSDYVDVSTPTEMAFNAKVAANLGSPVVLVVHGRGRSPADIRTAADLARQELEAAHAQAIAVIANRVEPGQLDAVRKELGRDCVLPVGAIPESSLLVAPTVQALLEACDGEMIRGNPEWLARESLGFVVAAMSLPNVLTRLTEDATVIAPGDRTDLLPGLLLAHQSGTFPHLSAIVLTGDLLPPEPVQQLIAGVLQDLPIIVSPYDTFETASRLADVHGRLNADSRVKVETALRLFGDSIDGLELLSAVNVAQA
ncbi:MAG: phosphotransacetylase family protein, partial [Nocardioidaceae bacterium]